MTPEIVKLESRIIVGLHLPMSFADYKIGELWKRFMPRRREVSNNLTNDLISVAVYPEGFFEQYQPTNVFERWAAVEVTDLNHVPEGMESLVLPGGLYAVFNYTGLSTDNSVFQYILGTWLPGSDYALDARPHFEVLGGKYRNNDPDSEEEIWIPVRLK